MSCDETLKVSAAQQWPPYSYLEDGVYKGLDIEILELVLTKAKLCWQYVSFPSSARAFKEVENNRVDLIFAASWNLQRERFAQFSVPYRTESMVLFSHVDNTQPFEFKGKRTIAVNRGSFYGNKFGEFVAQCEECIVEVSLAHQRFALLQNKRVDFSIEDDLTGSYTLQHGNFYNITKRIDSVIHNNHVHYLLGLNKKGAMAKERIDNAVKQLDKEISQLVMQYKQNLASG